MLALGWHDSQEKVPLVEPRAELKAMRPVLTTGGVGSLPTSIVATTDGSLGFSTSTTESVLSTVFSTNARSAAPVCWFERRATPWGIAPVRTPPRTLPDASSV